MDNLNKLWLFARGDIKAAEFERWLYQVGGLDDLIGAEYYTELIWSDFKEKYNVLKLRESLLDFLVKKYSPKCKCISLKSNLVVPMGDEAPYGLDTWKRLIIRTPCSYLAVCDTCQQNWFIVEEHMNDDYHCLRLDSNQVNVIVSQNQWPNELDSMESWKEVYSKNTSYIADKNRS